MTDLSRPLPVLGRALWRRPAFAAGLIVVEVAILVFVYRLDIGGLTASLAPDSFCRMMSGTLAICNTASQVVSRMPLLLIGVLLLFALRPTRPAILDLMQESAQVSRSAGWIGLNLLGLGLLLAPYGLWLATQDPMLLQRMGLWFWFFGALFVGAGWIGWLISPASVFRRLGAGAVAAIVAFMAFPELAWLFSDRMGAESTLQGWTFDAVVSVLGWFSSEMTARPATAELILEGFAVRIGHPCAGLTGIVFSVVSVGGYVALMRQHLNLGRVIWMIPVIAALSWGLNVVRIVVLMLIGARVSPDLAVGGFHSYAGWISFTALTGAMIVALDRLPVFQKQGQQGVVQSLSFWQDRTSAMILPFAVFLFSSLVAGALHEPISLGYPLRMAMTVAALLAFWKCWPVGWRPTIDPAAVGVGTGVALVWIAAQGGPAQTLADVAPGLAGVALVLWCAIRLAGTALVVPIVEEFIFRGYLMPRLSPDGRHGAWIGVAASSILFAALHGSWVLALGAGVAFGWLVVRSGRLFDAIVAHAVANGLIGLWVLVRNDWSVI